MLFLFLYVILSLTFNNIESQGIPIYIDNSPTPPKDGVDSQALLRQLIRSPPLGSSNDNEEVAQGANVTYAIERNPKTGMLDLVITEKVLVPMNKNSGKTNNTTQPLDNVLPSTAEKGQNENPIVEIHPNIDILKYVLDGIGNMSNNSSLNVQNHLPGGNILLKHITSEPTFSVDTHTRAITPISESLQHDLTGHTIWDMLKDVQIPIASSGNTLDNAYLTDYSVMNNAQSQSAGSVREYFGSVPVYLPDYKQEHIFKTTSVRTGDRHNTNGVLNTSPNVPRITVLNIDNLKESQNLRFASPHEKSGFISSEQPVSLPYINDILKFIQNNYKSIVNNEPSKINQRNQSTRRNNKSQNTGMKLPIQIITRKGDANIISKVTNILKQAALNPVKMYFVSLDKKSNKVENVRSNTRTLDSSGSNHRRSSQAIAVASRQKTFKQHTPSLPPNKGNPLRRTVRRNRKGGY